MLCIQTDVLWFIVSTMYVSKADAPGFAAISRKVCLRECVLDDIIVSSNSGAYATQAFTLLKQANLTVELEKCKFCKREKKYLDFKLPQDGVMVDEN